MIYLVLRLYLSLRQPVTNFMWILTVDVYTAKQQMEVHTGGGAVQVDAQTDCMRPIIWYDRWTPGDTTGNYIHILTQDTNPYDLYYNRIDTANNDTRLMGTAPVAVTTNKTNSFAVNNNSPAITKSTTGVLYMGVHDSGGTGDQSYVIRCSADCNLSGSWSDAGTSPLDVVQGGELVLMPLAGGNIMAIRFDDSADDYQSRIFTASTSTWAASWTNIDTSAQNNAAYDGAWNAIVNPTTNYIYLVYPAQTGTIGGNDDDVRARIYNGSSWSSGTDVVTNTTLCITGAAIGFDSSTSTFYVAYTARTTPATNTTANVYWKKSSDNMSTWSDQEGPINTTSWNLYGLRVATNMSFRNMVTWNQTSPNSYESSEIDIPVASPTFTQQSYRFYTNADSTDIGSPLANQDTTATPDLNADFRLRMLVRVDTATLSQNGKTFKLQYAAKGGGTCSSPVSAYADITTSISIAFKDNTTPSDGAALTSNANDPTDSPRTVRNQTYEEANNFTNSQSSIASGEDGMWDFSLTTNRAPASTTYCIRAVKSSGTALDTCTSYPEL